MIVVLVIAATRHCHSFAMGVSGSAALGRWLVVNKCAGHALELMMSMVPTMLLMIVVNVHADVRDACCAI